MVVGRRCELHAWILPLWVAQPGGTGGEGERRTGQEERDLSNSKEAGAGPFQVLLAASLFLPHWSFHAQ